MIDDVSIDVFRGSLGDCVNIWLLRQRFDEPMTPINVPMIRSSMTISMNTSSIINPQI
jgi:hypothetical protein